jgi:hypothetical protein
MDCEKNENPVLRVPKDDVISETLVSHHSTQSLQQ